MVTIAFGQVFYFIAFRWNSVTGGDDGLTGWTRLPIDFGFAHRRHPSQDPCVFYYFVLAIFAVASARWHACCARRSAAPLIAIRENERRARFLGVPVGSAHLVLVGDFVRLSSAWLARSTLCSTISSIRARCIGPSPAISSSWRCWAACARSGAR